MIYEKSVYTVYNAFSMFEIFKSTSLFFFFLESTSLKCI